MMSSDVKELSENGMEDRSNNCELGYQDRIYLKGTVLGEGGFSKVYSGIRKSDRVPVVIKLIPLDSDVANNNVENSKNTRVKFEEVQFLEKVAGIDGVIKLLDFFQWKSYNVIIMEKIENTIDLYDYATERGGILSEIEAKEILRQVLKIAIACKEVDVLHRDIKLENLLVNKATGKITLIDFGIATILSHEPFTSFTGTEPYCPPEWYTDGHYYGDSFTVWSLGILLYTMVTGRYPRNCLPLEDDRECISFPQNEDFSYPCVDILQNCLMLEYASRSSLEDLIEHPWFKK